MAVRTLLVAHDGSAPADRALAWAHELAAQTGARLVVVRSWSPLDDLGGPGPHDPAALHERARADLAGDADRVVGDGAEVCLVDDLPVPGVLRCAAEVGADLIVCGSRGQGRVRELVLGSVAHDLSVQANVPVVVVPAPDAD
ncbi:MAG: universal stress protein [Actinomycetes bacterium]